MERATQGTSGDSDMPTGPYQMEPARSPRETTLSQLENRILQPQQVEPQPTP